MINDHVFMPGCCSQPDYEATLIEQERAELRQRAMHFRFTEMRYLRKKHYDQLQKGKQSVCAGLSELFLGLSNVTTALRGLVKIWLNS